jgi:2-methylcitrate dehydratase PrpD
VLDDEVDAAYPRHWLGRVDVETTDGRTLRGRVDVPKGDPGNSLSRAELEQKAMRLSRFSGAANDSEVRAAIERILRLDSETSSPRPPYLLLPPTSSD